MTQLNLCTACAGFIPHEATSCPHCDTPAAVPPAARTSSRMLSRLVRGAVMLTSSSAFAITLMACYGAPPCEGSEDADGDGYPNNDCVETVDCDDDDAAIYPGADDPEGDGIDQNCDGIDGIASDGGVGDGGTSDDGDAGALDADGGALDAGA